MNDLQQQIKEIWEELKKLYNNDNNRLNKVKGTLREKAKELCYTWPRESKRDFLQKVEDIFKE